MISTSIITEYFCCDLSACGGACCIEGDAGAPVTLDEVSEIEALLDDTWPLMSAQAQTVVDRQGVAYRDPEGELVTSIVGGKDCVFTYYNYPPYTVEELPAGCCLCALEKAYRAGKTRFCKPVSCALYPIREKRLGADLVGLNYNRWNVCKMAIAKGMQENLYLYQFLRDPLIRRFGEDWYQELLDTVKELKAQGYL